MAQPNSANNKQNGSHVIICGGGIIGVCTAYYLAQRDEISSITIIERYKIAGCASGKAGGFLALDWCDNGWLEPLARKSFELHSQLGEKYGDRYLYRRCSAYSINSKYSAVPLQPKHIAQYNELKWIDCKVLKSKIVGTKSKCAQIHPRMFCETLIDLVQNKVNIKYAIVTGIIFDKIDNNKVIGIEYISNNNSNISQIYCDSVVITLGPWSTKAYEWFPKCKNLSKISSYKYNSIEVQPHYNNNFIQKQVKKNVNIESKIENKDEYDNIGNDKFLHLENNINIEKKKVEENQVENIGIKSLNSLEGAIYLNHKNKNNKSIKIEIYPRLDGIVYACGAAKRKPLPDDPTMISCDKYIEYILNGLKELSSKYLLNSKLLVKQACYLPQSEDDAPFIGQITNYKNAFIGTAHRVWGILNGPATGLILSQLI
eukprot:294025_1